MARKKYTTDYGTIINDNTLRYEVVDRDLTINVTSVMVYDATISGTYNGVAFNKTIADLENGKHTLDLTTIPNYNSATAAQMVWSITGGTKVADTIEFTIADADLSVGFTATIPTYDAAITGTLKGVSFTKTMSDLQNGKHTFDVTTIPNYSASDLLDWTITGGTKVGDNIEFTIADADLSVGFTAVLATKYEATIKPVVDGVAQTDIVVENVAGTYTYDLSSYVDGTDGAAITTDVGTVTNNILTYTIVDADLVVNVDIINIELKDYAEFRSVAYVDPGYTMSSANNDNTIIEWEVAFTGSDALFGYNKNNSDQILMGSIAGRAGFRWGDITISYGENLVVGRYYKMSINTITKQFAINDKPIASTFGNLANSYPISFGAFFGTQVPSLPDSGPFDFRSFRINVDGEDVVYLRPANADGVYDSVSNKYLTNANTRGTIESKDFSIVEYDYISLGSNSYIDLGRTFTNAEIQTMRLEYTTRINGLRKAIGIQNGVRLGVGGSNVFNSYIIDRTPQEVYTTVPGDQFNSVVADFKNKFVEINGADRTTWTDAYSGPAGIITPGYYVTDSFQGDCDYKNFKMYLNDVLTYDLVPIIINGNASTMINKVDNTICTVVGTVESSNIVDEMDYTEFKDYGYINTGYSVDGDSVKKLKITSKVVFNDDTNCVHGINEQGRRFYFGVLSNKVCIGYGNNVFYGEVVVPGKTYDFNLDIINRQVFIDGVEVGSAFSSDYIGNGELVVGGFIVNGGQVDTVNMNDNQVLEYKVYGADGDLDIDLVPATFHGSANGMYDRVSKQYYTNANSVGTIESKNN